VGLPRDSHPLPSTLKGSDPPSTCSRRAFFLVFLLLMLSQEGRGMSLHVVAAWGGRVGRGGDVPKEATQETQEKTTSRIMPTVRPKVATWGAEERERERRGRKGVGQPAIQTERHGKKARSEIDR
jgi:hypothetical protein